MLFRSGPDTGTLVARWIEEHVKPEEERVLIVPFIDFPLWRTEQALREEATIGWVSPWQRYQTRLVGQPVEGKRYDLRFLPLTIEAYRELALADPLALCRQVQAKYVAIPMADSPQTDPVRPQFLQSLRKVAQNVLRVPAEARGDPGEPMLLFDDMRGWPWSLSLLGDFSATGYVTEIYRIP